jgi:Uma2 family endonuclease
MSVQPKRKLSPQEYLAQERQAEFKSEYYQGEMFAMAGASEAHNLIMSNVIQTLGLQLKQRDCRVYPSDMRVKVNALGKYTYPDVVVVCGRGSFEDERKDILLNPVLIVEILSPSTEAYDRGRKFEHYQYIKSLAEYILITADAFRIEQYIRQTDWTWTYHEFHDERDAVDLPAIGCQLALGDVYAKVFAIPAPQE